MFECAWTWWLVFRVSCGFLSAGCFDVGAYCWVVLWLCLFDVCAGLCGLVVLLEFCSYACWCGIDSCSGLIVGLLVWCLLVPGSGFVFVGILLVLSGLVIGISSSGVVCRLRVVGVWLVGFAAIFELGVLIAACWVLLFCGVLCSIDFWFGCLAAWAFGVGELVVCLCFDSGCCFGLASGWRHVCFYGGGTPGLGRVLWITANLLRWLISGVCGGLRVLLVSLGNSLLCGFVVV